MEEQSGKLNIRYSGSGCSWSMVGGMIVKHLNWDMHPKWFSTYQKLRDFEPGLVEVYGYENRKIYMEYIEGSPLIESRMDQLKQNITLERYNQAINIMKNIGQWNLENNMCFINHALQLRNFMVENQTEKVYMIDPDSFHFYENGCWV